MKKLAIILLFALPAFAQDPIKYSKPISAPSLISGGTTVVGVPSGIVWTSGTAAPGTCNSGSLFSDTNGTGYLQVCGPDNTWTALGGGGLTGSLTATRVPYASGASTLVDEAEFTYDATKNQLTVSGGAPAAGTAEDAAIRFSANLPQATTGGASVGYANGAWVGKFMATQSGGNSTNNVVRGALLAGFTDGRKNVASTAILGTNISGSDDEDWTLENGESLGRGSFGLQGYAWGTGTGVAVGVYGRAYMNSGSSVGVMGVTNNYTGGGVVGLSSGQSGIGVLAIMGSPTNYDSGWPALNDGIAMVIENLTQPTRLLVIRDNINDKITVPDGATSVILEGTTDDANETTLTWTDPTADRTITLKDDTGTVELVTPSTKTLTESAATSFADITFANSTVIGGVADYTIEANDSTDFQALTGSVYFSGVNKAGTTTCGIGLVGTEVTALSTGTLTNTMTCTTAAGKITLQSNAVSSLTQTTLRIVWKVRVNRIAGGNATITGL